VIKLEKMRRATIALLLYVCAVGVAGAANYPCSQRKGGVNYCDGEKFVCNDGSISASKQKCSAIKHGTKDAPKPEKPVPSKNSKKVAATALICLVVGITDGDTIKVRCGETGAYEELKVRLNAIDAPEKKQAFGNRAREALSQLCFDENAQVERVGGDRYGRTIANVWCKGRDVSRFMVGNGWALVYDKYSRGYEYLYPLQEIARAAHRGLWTDKEPVAPWEWRKAERHTARN
jgi:endonuclease YncB( thermonuclease family)